MRRDAPVGTRVRAAHAPVSCNTAIASEINRVRAGDEALVFAAADSAGDYKVTWQTGSREGETTWAGSDHLDETAPPGLITLEAAAQAGADRVLDAVILWYLAVHQRDPGELTLPDLYAIEHRVEQLRKPDRGVWAADITTARRALGLT